MASIGFVAGKAYTLDRDRSGDRFVRSRHAIGQE